MLRALRVSACLAALVPAACGDDVPKETDFRAFGAEAAANRSAAYGTCTFRKGDYGDQAKAVIIGCMERQGYSYQPR